MNIPLRRRFVAIAIGIAFSVLLLLMESKAPLNPWVNFPDLPGFLVAIFTVTVNGPTKQFHAVIGVVNAVFYSVIVFYVLEFLYRDGTDSSK